MDLDNNEFRDILDEEEGIINVKRADGNDKEQLLPVHFMPEGRKCYDWIDDDIKNVSLEEENGDKTDAQELPLSAQILSAAEKGSLEWSKILLDSDSSLVKSTDSDLYTPLHRASYGGFVELAKLLISHGADVRAKTVDGWEPLHSACRWNQIGVAHLLLHNGANINAQSNGGLTALHLAATSSDRAQLIEMLLLWTGVKADVVSNANEKPHDIAWRNGEHEKLFGLSAKSINEIT